MIVRKKGEDDTLLLITQPDHARLSGDLLAAVRSEPPLRGRHRDAILLAAREHDNGWMEVDAEPVVDPVTGWPLDFTGGSPNLKLELWERGVMRVARKNLHAGALIAQHAVTVHDVRRSDPGWQPFLESMAAVRNDLLEQIGMSAGEQRTAFEAEYRCVQLADALSLHFCSGWAGPVEALGYIVTMESAVLRIAPDPFAGETVPLRVLGRRIAARRYRDDAELRQSLAEVAPQVVEGTASGA